MDLDHAVDRLDRDREAVRALVSGVPEAQARWKPGGTRWSLLEVMNHLLDEEREDFRLRLSLLIEKPGEPWPPIDPEGWVVSRGYNTRDLEASFRDWQSERERSLAWLRGLGAVDWERRYGLAHLGGYHARLHDLRAGDLLLAWVAHDLLHLRQLARTHVLYAGEIGRPYTWDYAGTL
jgi:hypothetical protein